MTESRVHFSPNVPQQVAFRCEGELIDGPLGSQVRYELLDGRTMYLSCDVAASINMMDIQPGELFFICKRWNGERSQLPRWDVWLSPDAEKRRAAGEIRRADPVPPKPAGSDRRFKAPQAPLPYDSAFRQALTVVTEGLKQSGEQWNDQAKQDAVSTILIAMAKAGRISWELGESA